MADDPPKTARTKLTISLAAEQLDRLTDIARFRTLTGTPTTPNELAAEATVSWVDASWSGIHLLLAAAEAAVRQATAGAAQ